MHGRFLVVLRAVASISGLIQLLRWAKWTLALLTRHDDLLPHHLAQLRAMEGPIPVRKVSSLYRKARERETDQGRPTVGPHMAITELEQSPGTVSARWWTSSGPLAGRLALLPPQERPTHPRLILSTPPGLPRRADESTPCMSHWHQNRPLGGQRVAHALET